MRRQVLMMVVTMCFVALGVMSARAQNAGTIAVNIPFEFAAGSKTLPAGEYYVRRSIEGAHIVVQIRSTNGSKNVDLPIHTVTGSDIQSESKLVFNRYGDQYFLAQVWLSGRTNGEEAAKTSRELTLQREMARHSIKPEKIAINGKLK